MEWIDWVSPSFLGTQPTNEANSIRIALLALLIVFTTRLTKFINILMATLRWMKSVREPVNYELDMTTNEYCKLLAEVNNNLEFQTKRKRVTQTIDWESNESLDCAIDLLSASAAEHTRSEPNAGNLRSNFAKDESNTYTDANYKSSFGNTNDTQSGSSEHVYPNGWLPVMESAKVKPGVIKRAIILGRDAIVTRSIEGEVSVLDAYCPHMGVHIGIGGRVLRVDNQSCVQCPFHGWTFRASDGQCVRIPYLKQGSSKCSSIPKQAKLKTWLCDEVDNFIYVWHHIDDKPPNWYLEPTQELATGKYILAGRSCHKTNLEIRDMHENGADMHHFEGIHNDLFLFGGNFLKVKAWNYIQKYSRHHWSPDWRPVLNDEGKPIHKAEMNLDSWIGLFKIRIFDIKVRATQIGPACVSLRYSSSWYGSGVLKMNAIPLGGRRTLYVQHIYTESSIFNWLMAKWVLFGEIMQLERDLFIWNHKKNIPVPVFIPEDKIIKRFRLWYSQFYKRSRTITIQDTDSKKEIANDYQKSILEF